MPTAALQWLLALGALRVRPLAAYVRHGFLSRLRAWKLPFGTP